ncbi:UNVERIFIED_CONTAM: hypothetical protein K2H54_045400 [Gekko kuhli]
MAGGSSKEGEQEEEAAEGTSSQSPGSGGGKTMIRPCCCCLSLLEQELKAGTYTLLKRLKERSLNNLLETIKGPAQWLCPGLLRRRGPPGCPAIPPAWQAIPGKEGFKLACSPAPPFLQRHFHLAFPKPS